MRVLTFAPLLLSASATTLLGLAELPAETFSEGPPSGANMNPSKTNGRSIPFPAQPVQGFSAIQFSPWARGRCSKYLAMPDNGFGGKTNSQDYLLRLYDLELKFRNQGSRVKINKYIQLADPDNLFPYPLELEGTPERNLTGGDIDPESFVIDYMGNLWVGEEFGPWMTHYDLDGKMLDAPIPTPQIDLNTLELDFSNFLLTKNHPEVISGTKTRNHGSSRGFEAMTFSPDRKTLYPILERHADGQGNGPSDPPSTVRVYEFSVEQKNFTRFVGWYQLDANSLGDCTPVNSTHILALERNGWTEPRGAAGWENGRAPFKKVFLVDLTSRDSNGILEKTLVADLMDIDDPNDLDGNGNNKYTFPYLTIEEILVLSRDTILVGNDNNYPETISRLNSDIDGNFFIKLRLDEPLHFDATLLKGGRV